MREVDDSVAVLWPLLLAVLVIVGALNAYCELGRETPVEVVP